tara:strand:- start:3104 stop:3814 length:711 start_codon:yes stop_codon:yes gene_type:complete
MALLNSEDTLDTLAGRRPDRPGRSALKRIPLAVLSGAATIGSLVETFKIDDQLEKYDIGDPAQFAMAAVTTGLAALTTYLGITGISSARKHGRTSIRTGDFYQSNRGFTTDPSLADRLTGTELTPSTYASELNALRANQHTLVNGVELGRMSDVTESTVRRSPSNPRGIEYTVTGTGTVRRQPGSRKRTNISLSLTTPDKAKADSFARSRRASLYVTGTYANNNIAVNEFGPAERL